jgi:excisionase family DNA binding protein
MEYPQVSRKEGSRLAYGVTEAAALYGVSKGLLRKFIREGRLPVKRVGRRVLILAPDLFAFFDRPPEKP